MVFIDPVSVFDFPDDCKCLYCPAILEYHEYENMLCVNCELRFHPNDYNYGYNYFNYGYITQDDFTDDEELEINPDLWFYDEEPSPENSN
jgi:hypothetical protein